MKKIALLLVVVFCIGALCPLVFAQEKETATTAASEEKLLHSFKTNQEMQEFEQLYVAKQATFGRMGVLQAYFSMEQANLLEIDKQMEEKFGFKMDPDKMYDLNREDMEIREVEEPSTATPARSTTVSE